MSACYPDFRGLSASQLIAMTLRDNDAASILNRFPNLRAMDEASVEEMETAGLSQEQAATLKAAIELGRRCLTEPKSKAYIKSAQDIYNLLGYEMGRLDREQIRVVMLDIRNGVIDIEIVSIGTIDSCVGHPREIFKNAIVKGAASIILTHNHPSGLASPSPEDLALTKRLMEVGKFLGIEVLDHVVIGDGYYCSIKDLMSQ
jgi:DNA repair protein RadC